MTRSMEDKRKRALSKLRALTKKTKVKELEMMVTELSERVDLLSQVVYAHSELLSKIIKKEKEENG